MATKTKSAAAKSTPAKSTALVRWDEKFAKYAKESKEISKGIGGTGGPQIKFTAAGVMVDGNKMPGGKMNVVIVGGCRFNSFYEGDYDPDNPEAPACYAYADTAEDIDIMAPHQDSAKKQSTSCAECEQNKFNTAKRGNGKACQNRIKFAVLTAKDVEDVEGIAAAEMAIGSISPTNLHVWKEYVDEIADEHGRPTWAVITEISSHPHDKNQIEIEFRFVDMITDDATLEALEARYLKVQTTLQQPYTQIERAAPKKGAAAKKAATPNRKFAAKKK